MPTAVAVPNRVFRNLLEVPVLFYVLCLVAYVTRSVSTDIVVLAWAYVGLRVVHSLIYLSYNRVMHRFVVFALSNVVLVFIWIRLLQVLVV